MTSPSLASSIAASNVLYSLSPILAVTPSALTPVIQKHRDIKANKNNFVFFIPKHHPSNISKD